MGNPEFTALAHNNTFNMEEETYVCIARISKLYRVTILDGENLVDFVLALLAAGGPLL